MVQTNFQEYFKRVKDKYSTGTEFTPPVQTLKTF